MEVLRKKHRSTILVCHETVFREWRPGKQANLPWNEQDNGLDKFRKLVKAASEYSTRSRVATDLEHFDEYLKLIWKLSLAVPLRYIDRHPFDFTGSSGVYFFQESSDGKKVTPMVLGNDESIRERLGLKANDSTGRLPFSVWVDGVELRRPIDLPSELRRSSRVSSPMLLVGKSDDVFQEKDLGRAGGQLSFEAYLYWNSQIIPKETSGALIRVREASGTLFDRNFLDYKVSEQNRLSQITAEIFVQHGLDSAINIDRESFNYSHPHFLYIQKWLHKTLRLLVNKNKGLAAEDLNQERQVKQALSIEHRMQTATVIWKAQQGEEADDPIPFDESVQLPPEVGGVEIEWAGNNQDTEVASNKHRAIAIVLQAYGVLNHLNSKQRSELIRDILKVLEDRS